MLYVYHCSQMFFTLGLGRHVKIALENELWVLLFACFIYFRLICFLVFFFEGGGVSVSLCSSDCPVTHSDWLVLIFF